MAAHSSILAWRTPWTEKPGGIQSMGSQRVRHDRSDLAHTHSEFAVFFHSPSPPYHACPETQQVGSLILLGVLAQAIGSRLQIAELS